MTTWLPAEEFSAETLYLNTASTGLPPRVTTEALRAYLAGWSGGRPPVGGWDPIVASARRTFADLVHVDPGTVAIGHQVSPLVGLLAASLPDGVEVLTATDEFTSVTFPFAAHASRGVTLIEAPLAELAEHVGPDTAIVAVSAVQSSDGALAPLAELEAACARHGAEMVVDLTQSAGWLDVDASRYAVTVTGAYKWLLSPRGSAFMTVRPDVLDRLRPLAAGWYAGDDVWDSIYGLPLRLAADARRFDVSPSWQAWVGTDASLTFLADIGVEALHDHALEVANAFADAVGIEPTTTAITSLAVDDAARAVLEELNVVAAVRAGRLRPSFHVHNTVDEAVRLGTALRGHVSN